MKSKIALLITVLSSTSYSQNSGIGTTTPDASAALDVYSTSKGVLLPRLTTSEKNAIANPATGLMVYNTDSNCLETYNENTWTNMCCGSTENPAIVQGAAGKIWMAYNLGATAPAASVTDYAQYGSLYQWGRTSDGHQLINWTSDNSGTPVNGVTTTLSESDDPNNGGLFIMVSNGIDWRKTKNDNLWQSVNGINNPCPIGFRLPTKIELENEIAAAKITTNLTAFLSCLKLPSAGFREYQNGTITNAGEEINIWTSTVSGQYSQWGLLTKTYKMVNQTRRNYAFSVRCIKD
jgi:uncharacterized protein (TIGR02145 family)